MFFNKIQIDVDFDEIHKNEIYKNLPNQKDGLAFAAVAVVAASESERVRLDERRRKRSALRARSVGVERSVRNVGRVERNAVGDARLDRVGVVDKVAAVVVRRRKHERKVLNEVEHFKLGRRRVNIARFSNINLI